jgi:hypothetical protein
LRETGRPGQKNCVISVAAIPWCLQRPQGIHHGLD